MSCHNISLARAMAFYPSRGMDLCRRTASSAGHGVSPRHASPGPDLVWFVRDSGQSGFPYPFDYDLSPHPAAGGPDAPAAGQGLP